MGRYAMKRGIIRDSTCMPCTTRYLASVHRRHFGPAMDNDSNHFGSVLYWKQKGAGRLSSYRRVPRHKTAPLRLDRYCSCSLSLAPTRCLPPQPGVAPSGERLRNKRQTWCSLQAKLRNPMSERFVCLAETALYKHCLFVLTCVTDCFTVCCHCGLSMAQ